MKKIYFLSLALPLGLAALVQACGGDNNPAPDDGDPPVIVGGATGSGGSQNGSGGENSNGTGGDIFQPPPDREACPDEPDGTQPAGSKIAGKACWKLEDCNPTEHQFLEQCSGTCLEPFDNVEKIPGYTGTLPPLRN